MRSSRGARRRVRALARGAVSACVVALSLGSAAHAESTAAPPPEAPPAAIFPSTIPATAPESAARWAATLERAARAIVTLHVTSPRPFDQQQAGYRVATGFVVDAKRGILVTNRHVAAPGPLVAEAVFLDNEEVDLRLLYRDPVHDFAFFAYDPGAVRYMEVAELSLAPERARVGAEIRVIGNDAGEKLSVLAGTLARLDREAPAYSRATYNDFNTFYFQAASGASGGSSGSPVLDIDGAVLALNAGGRRDAASSFFLPVDRVARALALQKQGRPVPRGTLQTIFVHRPYDELRRLGLRAETEAAMRAAFPTGTGLLIVDQVLAGGPADGALEPGDVIARVDGAPLDAFLPLVDALDGGVGRRVRLDLERGGVPRSVSLRVEDLHTLVPAHYLETGGAVLHPLSYQVARAFALPVAGVWVADSGYVLRRAGVGPGSVLTALGETAIDDVDGLEAALAALPHGARVPLRYFSVAEPRRTRVAVLEVDRRWFPMQHCESARGPAIWRCRPSPEAPRAQDDIAPVTVAMPTAASPAARALAASLVKVELDAPFPIDGLHGRRFVGAGLIIDAARGLVVVDRETVPVAIGDIALVFASSVRVPGELVYLHPEHNLAVVAYDPKRLGATPLAAATLREEPLAVGEDVSLVGLSAQGDLVALATKVARREPLEIPPARTPRFRDTNLETLWLADTLPTIGGVIADAEGRVGAFWATFSAGSGDELQSFMRGIPSERIAEIAAPLAAGEALAWRSLGVEWESIPLAEARDRGLPETLAETLSAVRADTRRVLAVRRREAGGPSAALLEDGDLLVSIDGVPVTRTADVERAAKRGRLTLGIARRRKARSVDVVAEVLSSAGTERAIVWAGALLHASHRAVALDQGIAPGGVYVAYYFYGSPAHRYGVRPTSRIVAVDEQPTPDLDAFVAAVTGRAERSSVRLRLIDLDGKVSVMTLRLDERYWPATSIERRAGVWSRRALSAASISSARAVPRSDAARTPRR
jgi:S1-C subfamily serine protease